MLVTVLAGCKSNSINEDEQNHLPESTLSENTEKTVLTLATFDIENIRNRVAFFNNSNSNYYIEIIDYNENRGIEVYDPNEVGSGFDYYSGLTRLNTEIIAGNVPDLLDLSFLPYYQYASSGLLEDIYPFIDSDPEFNRSDLIEGAFRASEIDGKLYQLFPTFGINTIAGHPSVLGSGMGWSLNELRDVLAFHPNADMPIGRGYTATKTEFLREIITHNIEEYIDWGNSSVSFDTDNFVAVLEFVNETFPAEPIMGDDSNTSDILFATGRQIMEVMTIYDLRNYQYHKAMFGGDIVFKGFPGKNEGSHSIRGVAGIGITSVAKDKVGAWQFLRSLLDVDYQLSFYNGFPTNRTAFDVYIQKWVTESNESNEVITDPINGEVLFELQPISQEDINNFMILIDSLSVTTARTTLDNAFWNVLFECADDFFSGRNTSQDAARIMQNRVEKYVSERG